jgi:hypothetical protein
VRSALARHLIRAEKECLDQDLGTLREGLHVAIKKTVENQVMRSESNQKKAGASAGEVPTARTPARVRTPLLLVYPAGPCAFPISRTRSAALEAIRPSPSCALADPRQPSRQTHWFVTPRGS